MYNLSTENYINYSPEICGASWSLEKSVCLCESVATRMETLCIRTTDLSQWFVPFYLLSIAILFWDTYFLQLTTADSCLWWKKHAGCRYHGQQMYLEIMRLSLWVGANGPRARVALAVSLGLHPMSKCVCDRDGAWNDGCSHVDPVSDVSWSWRYSICWNGVQHL